VDDKAETLDLGELSAGAAHYAALVREGRRITVTNRGEFVGYLVAADQPSSPFDRLAAAGQVRRATGRGIADLLPIPAPEPGESSPVDEVLRMREEERY
jgi:antitoxin (DNA-binding transcriptional repressor) of toxin-antitoxin stability system